MAEKYTGPKIELVEAGMKPTPRILKSIRNIAVAVGGLLMLVVGGGAAYMEWCAKKNSDQYDDNHRKAEEMSDTGTSRSKILRCLQNADTCEQGASEAAAMAQPGLERAFSQLYLHPHTAVECQEAAAACLEAIGEGDDHTADDDELTPEVFKNLYKALPTSSSPE